MDVLMPYHFGGKNVGFQITHQTHHIAHPPQLHARAFRYIDVGESIDFQICNAAAPPPLAVDGVVLLRMARLGTVPMIDFNGFHFGRDQSGDSPKTAVPVGRARMRFTTTVSYRNITKGATYVKHC